MQLNITKQQAQFFLTYQGGSDLTALEYLESIIRYKLDSTLLHVIRAAKELNCYIVGMELGTIPFDGDIDGIYRNLMCELVTAAQEIIEEE